MIPDLSYYMDKWDLHADAAAFSTHSSILQAVKLANGSPGMLKLAHNANEKLGHQLMYWWDAKGAARVYQHDADAVLLERATGQKSLLDMARNGQDDEATLIICQVAAQLHTPKNKALPEQLPALNGWFDSLFQCAAIHGGMFAEASDIARQLVATTTSVTALHGDLHHNNILDFEHRGWLAIDPHALIGEHYFDYAPIFCNEDLGDLALNPARFARQLACVCETAHLDQTRLLEWIIAYAALSASWFMEDNMLVEARHPLQVVELARQYLNTSFSS